MAQADEKQTDWSAIFTPKPPFGDPDDFGVLVNNGPVEDNAPDEKKHTDGEESDDDDCEQEACIIDEKGNVTADDYTLRKEHFKDWSINKIINNDKSDLKGAIKNNNKNFNENTAFWKFLKSKTSKTIYDALIELCKDKVVNLKKYHSKLIKNMSFDNISAITCYSTNAIYKALNGSLRSRSDEWAPFCGPFLSGLNKLPFVWDKLYRGTKSKTLKGYIHKYKVGAIVRWDSFISTSTSLGVARNFAKEEGTIFEIESGYRGRDVELFSAIQSEKEIIFSISSHFIITKIYKRGKRDIVALKELPFPWDANTILWVDDIPTNNKSLMEEFEAKGIMVIPRISTYGAKEFLDFVRHAINLNTFDKFRVITDMYRREYPKDDTTKQYKKDKCAGVTLIEALRKVGYKNNVCIYTGSGKEEQATNKCVQRNVYDDRVIVTASTQRVRQYGSFKPENK